MTDFEIPNFGELLAEHRGAVPTEAYPYLVSQLERTAADRYRGWAEDLPEHAEGLLACDAREDEIAGRVESMFPPSDEHRRLVATIIPAALMISMRCCRHYRTECEPYSGRSFSGSRHLTGM